MYEGKSIPIWQELAEIYRRSLLNNGYETTINYPYKYANFQTGEPINIEHRRLYYDALKKSQNLDKSPFSSYTDFYFNFMNNSPKGHLNQKTAASNQFQSHISSETLAGINVAGFLRSELGIGESARGYITAMQSLNYDVNLQDLSHYLESRKEDRTFTNFSEHNHHEVNLICVNADFVPILIDIFGTQYLENKYNIACWYWELPEFPQKWWQYFQHFQEIWVGSNYVYESLIKHSPIPVIKVSPVVGFKLNRAYNKQYFGLDNNEFVFLFMFDFQSIFERKNTLAVVEAFWKSFQPDEPVRLVLKCINGDKDPQNFELLKQAIADGKISLIDDYLSKDEKNGLLSICDCYISLHRAEGFGLTLAEAMFLEKPVIATGWSGNMDFMNINNSYPVKYKLTPLQQDYGPYSKGQIWAEPDIAHAAQLMRQVYDNPLEAKCLARRAAEDIRQLHSPLITSKQIQARLQTISQSKTYQWEEAQNQLKKLQTELEQTQHQLQISQNMVTAMMTSKFWRVRKCWFKFKNLFGLNKNEQIV
jgi:glycosyltransferase involved in cell wall biosynthesis